ncbi:MAG: hypothetical protein ACRD2N_03215 [Vicinamibacterales bacterium]
MLWRVARDTGITCAIVAGAAAAVWPGRWRIPLGVLGGGLLIALSLWGIRGAVDGWLGRAGVGEVGAKPPGLRASLGLVKFFTRYAMLAFAAYVMVARLHLDPVGLLAGVSALGVAAGVEVVRSVRVPTANRRG